MAWTLELNVNDGYPHNENILYAAPGIMAPYPDGMWQISAGVNDGYPHNVNTLYGNPGLVPPYPDGTWQIHPGVNDGYPYQWIDTATPPGACCMCEGLYSVTIPSSVLSIGRYAFWGTALTTVRIAPACEYFSTTFPTDCEIYHYTDSSNLVDSTGRYLLTKDKKLLKAREASNG